MIETERKMPTDEVCDKGIAIYAKIKDQYEPKYNGKFLVIDVVTGDVYMAERAAFALEAAQAKHPGNMCYVLRIGFDFVYQM